MCAMHNCGVTVSHSFAIHASIFEVYIPDFFDAQDRFVKEYVFLIYRLNMSMFSCLAKVQILSHYFYENLYAK